LIVLAELMDPRKPMILTLAHWLVSGLALLLTSAIVPGFRIRGFGTALLASFIIGVLNRLVYPILFLLTLPLTLVTLGLFLVVLNAIVLKICAAFLKNFEISGWLAAIFGAIILSVTSSLLHWLLI